jgi:MFS family permease
MWLVGAVNVLFTVLSASLVDRAGRKTLLVMSHTGCFASLTLLTGVIFTAGGTRMLNDHNSSRTVSFHVENVGERH